MSDWRTIRLEDVIHIKHGYAFKGEHFSDEQIGPVLLTPGNFSIGGGFKKGKPKYYLGPIPEDFVLAADDLVVTMTDLSKAGDTLGYPALVPAGSQYLHNQRIGLIVVKTPDEIDKKFLYYAMRTDSYRQHVVAGATGSTVRHTSPTRICDYILRAPGLATQRALAAALGTLDDKIAVNDLIAHECHELANLIYQDCAQGWSEVPLASLVTPILGGTPDRTIAAYWGRGNLWASAKDVAACRYGTLLSTEEEITDFAVEDTKAKPVPKGSVILTARGTVGAVARVCQPTSVNQSCYAFIPDFLPPALLYLTLQSAAQRMLGIAHGTVFSTVNMKTLEHIHVPSLSKGAVSVIEQRTAPLLDVIECSVRESRALAQLRDSLLPLLMSGEIRVRDAEKVVEEAT